MKKLLKQSIRLFINEMRKAPWRDRKSDRSMDKGFKNKLPSFYKSFSFLYVLFFIILVQFWLFQKEKKQEPQTEDKNFQEFLWDKYVSIKDTEIKEVPKTNDDVQTNQSGTNQRGTNLNIDFANLKTFSARVSKIIDGDSLRLEGEKRDIRIWGYDAPEYSQKNYDNATNLLRKLAFRKHVTCQYVVKDRYDRQVARCFIGNEITIENDISYIMINSNLVREYCRFSKNFYGTCLY